MKQHRQFYKQSAVIAMLLVLLMLLNGCFSPDRRSNPDPTGNLNILPYDSADPYTTPTAPLDATTAPPYGGDQTGSGWDQWGIVGQPTSTPNVQIVTPTTLMTVPPAATATRTPIPTPSPGPNDGTLRVGSSGDAVRELQRALRTLGYISSSPDGSFGSATQSALIAFQKANGLTADGVAGSATLAKLYGGNAVSASAAAVANATATIVKGPSEYRYLQEGTSGNDVKQLQQRLAQLGYYAGSSNGKFDSATTEAVKAFQERHKLWVDGVAGEITQKTLFSSSAKEASNTSSSSTTYRTLKEGMSGDDVSNLQNRLYALGYLTASATGYYGTATTQAVKDFQTKHSLTVDGVAGSGTQSKLYSTAAKPASSSGGSGTVITGTLREGDTGEAVTQLQQRLKTLGYLSGSIDGKFGVATTTAVASFQQRNGLTIDGVAGPATQERLFSASAISASGGSVSPTNPPTINPNTYLQEGSKGDDVRMMQNRLIELGYLIGTADGEFGVSTKAAVIAFQTRHNLYADGIAGAATLLILYSDSAKHAATTGNILPDAQSYATLKPGNMGQRIA